MLGRGQRRHHSFLVLLVLMAIGSVRIIATYGVFNQVLDEPAHVAAGMEWIDRGRYTYETLHPPLARIAVAIGPFLDGLRSIGRDTIWREGNAILYARDTYERNLSLARLGVLPFFLLATWLVWLWARDLFGGGASLVAAGLFTTLPPVLAHAGLATTDMAVTATLPAAIIVLCRWLERPTPGLSLWLGLTAAITVLTKLSALVFLPACAAVLLALRVLPVAGRTRAMPPMRARLLGLAIAALAAGLTVWAGYRFSVGSLASVDREGRLQRRIERMVGHEGPLPAAARAIGRAPVFPAPALWLGVLHAAGINASGQASYILGRPPGSKGVWYFFPVALAVKTPLPFLVLTGLGIGFVILDARRSASLARVAPAATAGAILLVCLWSNINIGVRHVLPIYPMLAVTAGAGAAGLWAVGRRRHWGRAVLLALLGWQVVSTTAAHPDYLAYFNEVVRGHPERVLLDSDLDWGQDLERLARALAERRIGRVALAYHGTADVGRHGLPPTRVLVPYQRTTGWIAISVLLLKTRPGFAWLEAYEPVAVVGRSIWLYNVPETPRGGVTPSRPLGTPLDSSWGPRR